MVCKNNQLTLCGKEECKICFPRSFQYYMISILQIEKLLCWIDKDIKPSEVYRSDIKKKYKFICYICDHIFEISIQKIVYRNQWCCYCYGNNGIMCNLGKNCEFCYKKSLEYHMNENIEKFKTIKWSSINSENPSQISKCSHIKYVFECNICEHKFSSTLNNITTNNSKCPYCNHNKICFDFNCDLCFNNSFASFENKDKLKCWSDKNQIRPRNVFKSTHIKYIFKCSSCERDFKTPLNNIISQNKWCPYCKYKTQTLVFDYLKIIYKDVKDQFSAKWCKNKKVLPFDFMIPELKIIIEVDGKQHFQQVSNWQSSDETLKNDCFKMKCANENGYNIVRISQIMVYENKVDWKKLLLEQIIRAHKQHINIFLSIGPIYKNHIEELRRLKS